MGFIRFIEDHFTLILLLSCAVGLAMPQISHLPDGAAAIVLGFLTFFSCFKLRDGGFHEIRWKKVLLFYICRYVLLPIIFLCIARQFSPTYATAIFLMALVPTAVSSPAFVNLFGGHVASAFALVLLSTLAAPLLIPMQFALAGDGAVAPAPMFLFKTLVMCIFIPVLCYLVAKKHQRLSDTIYKHNKFLAIMLVAFIIAMVVSKQRELILGDVLAIIPMVGVNILCFIVFLLVGWHFVPKNQRELRISFATCSMFNNVALGVSLALLHFHADVIIFITAGEMAWALLPALMDRALRWL